MTDREAMKMALEALEWITKVNAMDYEYQRKAYEPIEALRQALAQPEQPILICTNCGADRSKEGCKGERTWCPFAGKAQTEQDHLSDAMSVLADVNADLIAEAKLAQPEQELGAYDVPTCKTHPDAPHGFDRFSSHNQDRYVCLCEGWSPCDMGVLCLDCRPRNADGSCPDTPLRKNNDKR